MKLKRRFLKKDAGSTFDLNLAPMMDMMVTIIPFLLLSAVFMRMMLIDVPLPQPVAKALDEDRGKKTHEVSIAVNLGKGGMATLSVTDDKGKSVRTPIPAHEGDFDVARIHQKLVEAKTRFPKTFRLEVNPESGINYKSLVAVMDSARMLEKNDPKVFIENNEVRLLFPDVVLANLMEN